jgi:Flp pilus assembly protein TadD
MALATTAITCGPPQQETGSTVGRPTGTVEDGKVLIEQGEFEAGAQLFGQIVAARPSNAEARFYHGVCLDRLGRTDEALAEYKEAVRLDGNLMEAHNNLGLLLLDNGDLDAAKEELSIFLEGNREDADAHYNFGILLAAMDQKNAAKASFEEASRLAPEDPLPILGLGDLARDGGRTDQALELYRKARRAAPQDQVALLSEAQALVSLKKADEAASVLGSIGALDGADAAALTTAGMLLAKMDRDAEAVGLYRQAISRDEGYPRAHVLLANALARTGDFAGAARHFERFIELAPEAPEVDAARKGLEICKAKAPAGD